MAFYLGGPVDESGTRLDEATTSFDPNDLTTHGVIVDMTIYTPGSESGAPLNVVGSTRCV